MVLLKARYAFDHVKEYVEREGCGLGLFSEQTAESVHADFRKKWANYKLRDVILYSTLLIGTILNRK
jgi:hypothetical protein